MDRPADGKDLGLPPTADRRRVVVLAGPSGSGKSRLANRLHAARGWPVFRLDDFCRDAVDPRSVFRIARERERDAGTMWPCRVAKDRSCR